MDNLPRHVVVATPELAGRLLAKLKGEHRREILACGVYAPGEALASSLAASMEAYAYTPDAANGGAPLFMMGVEAASPITGGAVVWMLGGEGLERCPRAVLRVARWGVARAFAVTGAAYLEQRIPDWYETGLRFVRRLGFTAWPAAAGTREGGRLMRVVIHRHEKAGKEKKWEH